MTNWPTSTVNLTNPTASDSLAAVPHHTQHGTVNDELAAMEDSLRGGWGGRFDARAHGQVGDGSADDTVAIQSAIDAAAAVNGGDVFVHGLAKITATILISTPNIRLHCGRIHGGAYGWESGSGWDIGSFDRPYDSGLLWAGAAGGTMVKVHPGSRPLFIGQDGRTQVSGAGVFGTLFAGTGPDYADGAAVCLHLEGVDDSEFAVWCVEPTSCGVLLTGAANNAGGSIRLVNTMNRFRFHGARIWRNSGVGLRVEGNCSYRNVFITGHYQHRDGDAIQLAGCDNNRFQNTRIFRWGTPYNTPTGALPEGTGTGVNLLAGVSHGARPRTNIFETLAPGKGGVVSQGTDSDTYPAYENVIERYDADIDAPAAPIVGTGSTLFWFSARRPPSTMQGSSFPASPTVGDLFFNTTYNELFYYSGSSTWRTVAQYDVIVPCSPTDLSASGVLGRTPLPHRDNRQIYISRFHLSFFITGGTPLDGSNKWVVTMGTRADGATSTTGGGSVQSTITIDSGDTGKWRAEENVGLAIFPSYNNTAEIVFNATKTGTPGTLLALAKYTYRSMVTV